MFLHEVAPGVADRSYGVQVARLAGLPPAVVKRARALLAELEGRGRGDGAAAVRPCRPTSRRATFCAKCWPGSTPTPCRPREAQAMLYELKRMAAEG